MIRKCLSRLRLRELEPVDALWLAGIVFVLALVLGLIIAGSAS